MTSESYCTRNGSALTSKLPICCTLTELCHVVVRGETLSHVVSNAGPMECTNNDAGARVLSIQSHVVSGYAGNKCAVFPMQIHGFEVDTIDTVQFSNHTGYRHWKGQILRLEHLKELYEGLRLADLLDYTHCLTGYVADELVLAEVANIVSHLLERNPNLVYVCDPVMGDCGNYYVSKAMLPIYRDRLLPLADVTTPNQFELEELTGIKVNCEADIVGAMTTLLLRTIKKVVVTSTELDLNSTQLCGYFGERKDDGRVVIHKFEVDRFKEHFVGTGDLFASLLLVWLHKTDGCLLTAVSKAQASVQDVLKHTLYHTKRICPVGTLPSPKALELRIVQSVDHLSAPKSSVKIIPLE
uniref:Pyridoxal kinase n=1 Tax=Trichuris muris TaxID=70415 RepID=A0A5S6Q6G1_TRIMR